MRFFVRHIIRNSVFLVALFSLSFLLQGSIEEFQLLQRLLIGSAQQEHFNDIVINDTFSSHAWDSYIEQMDPHKRFFTQEDIDELNAYRYNIDNEILMNQFNFFSQVIDIYDLRINQFAAFYSEYIDNPPHFQSLDSYETDPDKMSYAINDQVQKQYWKSFIDYRVLTQYINLLQAEITENITINMPIDPELSKKAQKNTLEDLDKYIERYDKESIEEKEHFYLNALLAVFDTHTSYFPASKKEQFDIHMSGKLEGIGAELSESNGYIKVVRIVPGSASHRQGDLKPEDLILKVAQENEAPVNTIGMKISDIVQIIRGKKGTAVTLTVRHSNNEEENITIIRDIVEIAATYTKSLILNDDNYDKKIGYIHIPKFYRDVYNSKNRNTTDDMKAALTSLSLSGVDGIILDLRYNEGGFLLDAVNTAGLFIESGPIVQVKDNSPNVTVHSDFNSSIYYHGPLVILINPYSASASEILAAAMQDYNRAIVVGTTSFGKGTVQKVYDFNPDHLLTDFKMDSLGSLKLTIQKFYRIDGGSTQEKGVIPDIIIPDTFAPLDIGERYSDFALPWDTIDSLNYELVNNFDLTKSRLRENSLLRISQSKHFDNINQQVDYLYDLKNNSSYPLNLNHAIQLTLDRDKLNQTFEDQEFNNNSLQYVLPESVTLDPNYTESYDNLFKRLKSDLQLDEAIHILIDLIDLQSEPHKTVSHFYD